MRTLAALGLSVALGLGLSACGDGEGEVTYPPSDGTMKVGVILPMTGGQGTYGEESWNGMQMAIDELKAAGKSAKWELILRDEKSTKQESGNHAKSLIEGEEVHVLIGSVASAHTIQIFKEASESGVPCISPASTKDGITSDPLTSRICFQDSFQGQVLANFATGEGWKKVSLVIDKAQPYAVGLAKNFEDVFTASGGAVTHDYYSSEDTDFSNVIQSVAAHKPDAVFISGYYPQAGPMVKQSKGTWDGLPVIGGDGLDSPDLANLIGDTSAEIYMSSHFASDMPDERVQAWAKRYHERFGKPPGAMAGLGYDVLFVLDDAVGRCENVNNPNKLAKAIASTKGLKGITGTISLDNDQRTPIKDAVIVRLDGTFKFHKQIKASK